MSKDKCHICGDKFKYPELGDVRYKESTTVQVYGQNGWEQPLNPVSHMICHKCHESKIERLS